MHPFATIGDDRTCSRLAPRQRRLTRFIFVDVSSRPIRCRRFQSPPKAAYFRRRRSPRTVGEACEPWTGKRGNRRPRALLIGLTGLMRYQSDARERRAPSSHAHPLLNPRVLGIATALCYQLARRSIPHGAQPRSVLVGKAL